MFAHDDDASRDRRPSATLERTNDGRGDPPRQGAFGREGCNRRERLRRVGQRAGGGSGGRERRAVGR